MNQPQPTPSTAPKPQGGSSTMKWFLIILVIILVLGGGYLLYQKYGKGTTASPTASASAPADWKTYTNIKYGYSLKYPNQWGPLSEATGEKWNSEPSPSGSQITLGPGSSPPYNVDPRAQWPGVVIIAVDNQAGKEAIHTSLKDTSSTGVMVGIDKVTAQKGSISTGNYYLIERDSKTYLFIEYENDRNLDQILSTFQFTE